jgi:hypothetical protein
MERVMYSTGTREAWLDLAMVKSFPGALSGRTRAGDRGVGVGFPGDLEGIGDDLRAQACILGQCGDACAARRRS